MSPAVGAHDDATGRPPGEPGGLTWTAPTRLHRTGRPDLAQRGRLQRWACRSPASEQPTAARQLRCPALFQIADFDRYVPADSVAKTAVLAGRGAPLSV